MEKTLISKKNEELDSMKRSSIKSMIKAIFMLIATLFGWWLLINVLIIGLNLLFAFGSLPLIAIGWVGVEQVPYIPGLIVPE